jgi:tRNA threonylcarbamoyladenosine biosynthesis protein TsaE
LLVGGLGAGKTCLSQGIARGLGIKGYVMSPSFVLVREHREGRLPLYHLDFYRLQSIEELQDLGLDDYFYGQGVCIVEWAEKGLSLLPSGHLMVNIEIAGQDRRHFRFQATDEKHHRIIDYLTLQYFDF